MATAPLYDLTDTWNAAGTTFTGLKLNVTDTASNAASLLLDLQVGGASRFSVTKIGQIRAIDGTATAPAYSFANATNNAVGIWLYDVNTLALRGNGSGTGLNIAQNAVRFSTNPVAWGADFNNTDLFVLRDAADTLAQRNGTNAQTFRIYNTFTDASNYERGKMEWASNVLRIGTEKAGTGTARALELQTNGVTALTINANQVATFAGLVVTNGVQGIQIADGIYGPFWTAGTTLASSTNGNLTLFNFALNDWGRLQFGGTTSSYPALKRSSAALIVRLADDSANAALESASVKTDAPAGGTSGTWKLGVAASVSPTSPNRTIEVDIGGTIYYLAAKTTND
jgi:hypothetical protein